MRPLLAILALSFCLMGCHKETPVIPSTNEGNSSPNYGFSGPGSRPEKARETDPAVLYGVTTRISTNIGGYYIALPAHYQESTKPYPMILFMHGAGVYGNGSTELKKVLIEALPLMLNNQTFPSDFVVNGQHYSFIVMIPQFAKDPDNPDEVMEAISYAQQHYRIDSSRIYLTGISSGSVTGGYACAAHPNVFAAFAPIAGVTGSQYGIQRMVDAKLPIWAFHNNDDQRINVNFTKDFISTYNSLDPAIPARLTLFSAYGSLGHNAWTKAENPAYKEDGKNMYEWMLQYSR